jgi:predicted lipid-binding transport protein (Tim44 family)
MRRALIVVTTVAWCLVAMPLGARPGGGESFGGSSPPSYSPPSYSPSEPSYSPGPSDYGSSGGGGGGGGGGLSVGATMFFFALFVVVAIIRGAAERKQQDWNTSAAGPSFIQLAPQKPLPPKKPARRTLVEMVSEHDPGFSLVLFEDFLYSLFAAYHEARGSGARHDVTPYVDAEAARYLTTLRKDEVRTVIVGSMAIGKVRKMEGRIAVEVSFEANYEEVQNGAAQAFYSQEDWVLQRSLEARSRTPEHATIDECPNCGGALGDMDGNVCTYCKQTLTPGRFDWALTHISVERSARGPMLGGSSPEQGTSLPTIVIDGAEQRLEKLVGRDATFAWPAFQERVGVIFEALHRGWCARDWRSVRPYVSDQLFQSQLYWIEEYKKQRMSNRTDGARIVQIGMSNVESDPHFDAITVRVFATGKDYTIRDDGSLVSGSKTVERPYSEYWTLIRGRSSKGSAASDAGCPNCGAPLEVNMAGSCTHCGVKVTRGDFDWVLSRIEQDEAYG